MKQYTIAQFNQEYPNEEVCIEEIFQARYGGLESCPGCGVMGAKFFKLKKRKAYSCMYCRHQIHPLAGTIFHKSETDLTKWFYAIYLFSQSKNGVSAKELERHLGVTYKTAWRMAKQIRSLMKQDDANQLRGTVEADETYMGGRAKGGKHRWENKTAVLGATERKGKARAIVTPEAIVSNAADFIQGNVAPGSELHTDESSLYTRVGRNYIHQVINHGRKQYVAGSTHTNSIEGFWSQLKRSVNGTYHAVSPKYLQSYVDEFVFRYNLRNVLVYPVLVSRAARPVESGA